MLGRNVHGFDPIDRYCLRDLWSLHVYGYHAKLTLDGTPVEIFPRAIGLTPPNTVMEYRYFGLSVHIYAHFALPPGPTRRVLAMQDLGVNYDSIYPRLYEGVELFSREPHRVQAKVWDVLWEAVSLSGDVYSAAPNTHRAVRIASDLIERNLDNPLSVTALAREADVSTSYLVRLFQEAYGESVVGYIRRRRMERAKDLLVRSTLPIKMIAASIGISDLQQFNKAVRAQFGVSPRGLRREEHP